VTKRTGYEVFTGAYHPVVFDQIRADADLPPWRSTLDGQFFMNSEVVEDGKERPDEARGQANT
jgi:hypothetical protein